MWVWVWVMTSHTYDYLKEHENQIFFLNSLLNKTRDTLGLASLDKVILSLEPFKN